MRRRTWREQGAALLIGLSLWMALPAFQWCSIDWETCRLRLAQAAACEAARPADEAGCDLGRCPLARDCDPSPSPRSSRAWCVGAHPDGVVPREMAPPPPDASSLAILGDAPARPAAPPAARAEAVERAGLCHGIVAAHAPPLTRAPPLA
jgi:hypothetical protein